MAPAADGMRRAKIEEMKKLIPEVHEYARKWQETGKGKWMNRPKKGRQLLREEARKGEGVAYHQEKLVRMLIEWLPKTLDETGIYQEPLDADELGELFYAFVPESGESLRDSLDTCFQLALPKAKLNTSTVILKAMIKAGIPHPSAWQTMGEHLMRRCQEGPHGDLGDCVWALSSAQDELPEWLFSYLRKGLDLGRSWLSKERRRTLGAMATDVGLDLPDIFGAPPFLAEADASQRVWAALAGHVVGAQGTVIHSEPTPVISLPGAISEEDADALVRLADHSNLWRPAARKGPGSDNPGAPVEGTPWSALLDRPVHQVNRAVWKLRLWVADALGVPADTVEPVRLVRYREGEGSLRASADARPPKDASLWQQGQRTAVAMVALNSLPPGAGGELVFGALGGLRVAPQAGNALIWPTVNMSGFPEARFARSSLPVVGQGVVKYTAITWVRSHAPRDGGDA